jgi:phosphohistidine phosphatase
VEGKVAMDLYIIRHAWAEDRGAAWPDDSLRPLTDEGRERMARMIENLAERGFSPEIIAASPMVRCMQTAQIVAEQLADRPRVVSCEHLLPGGDPKLLLAWTEAETGKYEQIAWVGHAPDVDLFALALIGQGDGAIRFSKGAIAAIRFAGVPELGRGELRWLVTGKILGC